MPYLIGVFKIIRYFLLARQRMAFLSHIRLKVLQNVKDGDDRNYPVFPSDSSLQ
jgi:hypothetical protein